MKVRNFKIELIRLLACLLVIWYHLRERPWKDTGELSEAIVFFECITCIAVIVFYIISGFFIYDKKGNIFKDWINLIKKFLLTIYVPFLILAVISLIFNDFFINAATISECINRIDVNYILSSLLLSIKNFSVTPSLPGTSAHFWYIYLYFVIMLVYPITRFVLTKCDRKIVYAILIVYFAYMAFNDYKIFYGDFLYNFILEIIKKPIMYSAFGYILYHDVLVKMIDEKKTDTLIINKKLFVGTIITYVVAFCLLYKTQSAYYIKSPNSPYVYISWLSFYSFVLATCFILFFYNINFDKLLNANIAEYNVDTSVNKKAIRTAQVSAKLKDAVYFLASKTLGIYMVHYFITNMFFSYDLKKYILYQKPTIFHQLLHYFILTILVFTISLVIVVLVENVVGMILKPRKLCKNGRT